jgi:hypothetical protein
MRGTGSWLQIQTIPYCQRGDVLYDIKEKTVEQTPAMMTQVIKSPMKRVVPQLAQCGYLPLHFLPFG